MSSSIASAENSTAPPSTKNNQAPHSSTGIPVTAATNQNLTSAGTSLKNYTAAVATAPQSVQPSGGEVQQANATRKISRQEEDEAGSEARLPKKPAFAAPVFGQSAFSAPARSNTSQLQNVTQQPTQVEQTPEGTDLMSSLDALLKASHPSENVSSGSDTGNAKQTSSAVKPEETIQSPGEARSPDAIMDNGALSIETKVAKHHRYIATLKRTSVCRRMKCRSLRSISIPSLHRRSSSFQLKHDDRVG